MRSSVRAVLGTTLQAEGVRGLYRGFLPNALKNLPNKGVSTSWSQTLRCACVRVIRQIVGTGAFGFLLEYLLFAASSQAVQFSLRLNLGRGAGAYDGTLTFGFKW